MPKPHYLRNAGKPISPIEVKQVRTLAKGNTPTGVIALKVGRSVASVRAIAFQNKIPLKPTNQSPYGPRR